MSSNLIGDFTFNEDLILQNILCLLGPKSLLKVVAINSLFERIASDNYLWEKFNLALWKGKQIICTGIVKRPKPRTFPYSKICLSENGYKSLSALELKYILRERKVDVRGCSEKKEFIQLALESNNVTIGVDVEPIVRPFRDKWKASFYTSLRDGHRTRATKDDICTYTWAMTFKHNPGAPKWTSSFHRNMTLTSEPSMNNGQNFDWCFYGDHDEYIRVAQYPPLIITRLPDWGWRMENQYVYFERTNQKLM